jgi:uncharacterized membrane protein
MRAGPHLYAKAFASRTAFMTQRARKFTGAILLILLIAVYALLALAVAVVLQIRQANGFVEFVYYIVAGLLWVLPAGLLIKWMAKPDVPKADR